MLDRSSDGARLRRHQARRRRHEGFRGRLPGRDADGLRRADHAGRLCGDHGRGGGSRARAGGRFRLLAPRRPPPLRADLVDDRGRAAGIWAFLGSDRLGRPIAEHAPDLVLHGHGHAAPTRASSARSRSTTCRSRSWAGTSRSSSWAIQRYAMFLPTSAAGRLIAERRFIEHSLDHPHSHPGSRAAGLLLARLLVGPGSP